jgi:beta-galactosidase/beta-glucuronidase
MSMPRPEYPRPDMVRDTWLNLNGAWEFELDPGRSGIARGLADADSLSDRITVPFCPESRLSGIANTDFMPCVWYRRAFFVPKDWAGQRVILHFGAVDYLTRVWVNGQDAGGHRGGYAPFSFDITDLLTSGENVVTVCAEDDTRDPLQPRGKQSEEYLSHGCDYTRTTGIWQTVWLEPVPKAHIRNVKMTPNLSIEGLRVDVFTTPEAHDAVAELVITADGEQVARMSGRVIGDVALLGAHLSMLRVWCPQDPFLYDVEITLRMSDGTVDHITSYAGMRSLGMSGQALLLNGKPQFQRLVLDQGFYPDGIYTAPTDDDLRRDIEISQGLGFDGARLHMRVFEPRFLYWADKLGYLVWGEYANWGLSVATMDSLPRFLEEWLTVLDRDMNHPSIVGWCPFNETTADQEDDVLQMVYRTTKAIDPTRPCIDTSGYVHCGMTDVHDCHNYEQDPEKFAAAFEPMKSGGDVYYNHPGRDAKYDGQPYFVSEYGGIWWNPGQEDGESWGYGGEEGRPQSEEEFIARYRGLTEALLNHPGMCGFCYTQLYDIEQEVNGLYTYDRKPKFDPAIIREINQQTAAIEAD